MPSRRADVFFYGLFMDPDLLREKGLTPEEIEPASITGWALRIGSRAAIVPEATGRVHGVLMALTLQDLDRLYADQTVAIYRPFPVLVTLGAGGMIAALCYNLPEPPSAADFNPAYAAQLAVVGRKMGLPDDYVASLEKLRG